MVSLSSFCFCFLNRIPLKTAVEGGGGGGWRSGRGGGERGGGVRMQPRKLFPKGQSFLIFIIAAGTVNSLNRRYF